MYSIEEGERYVYRNEVYVYHSLNGLTVNVSYRDYRKITAEEVLFLKGKGFNFIRVGFSDEKPKNWKDFNIVEDNHGSVFFPYDNFEDVIQEINKYNISQGYNQNYIITFSKFISLSDIEDFCLFKSYIQIGGKKFPFRISTACNNKIPGYECYKDKFYIFEKYIDERQRSFLTSMGYKLVSDTPENQYERQKYPVFPISFSDIDGFVIEKQNCDINDFGKDVVLNLIGEKKFYFLDRKNPDPELLEMLRKYKLINFFDTDE